MTSKVEKSKIVELFFVNYFPDPAAGVSDDWYKGVLKSRFAYCVELRDNGNYGFLLPPEQIKSTGEELWAAQRVVFQKMVDLSNDETTPTPQPPSGGCGSPEWAFDDWCDDENNNAGCNYDDGACCKNYAAGIPAGTGTV